MPSIYPLVYSPVNLRGRSLLLDNGLNEITILEPVAGTSSWDRVWLFAHNMHTSPVDVWINLGDASNRIVATINPKEGWKLIIPGFPMQNGFVISGYGSTGNLILVNGYIERGP